VEQPGVFSEEFEAAICDNKEHTATVIEHPIGSSFTVGSASASAVVENEDSFAATEAELKTK